MAEIALSDCYAIEHELGVHVGSESPLNLTDESVLPFLLATKNSIAVDAKGGV